MSSLFSRALRPLRGANLEVFKFGMYLLFPIGWMYYFGTNLENRFTVADFWPTQEQSHKIPFERDEIKAEVERIQKDMKERREWERKREVDSKLRDAANTFSRTTTTTIAAGGGASVNSNVD